MTTAATTSRLELLEQVVLSAIPQTGSATCGELIRELCTGGLFDRDYISKHLQSVIESLTGKGVIKDLSGALPSRYVQIPPPPKLPGYERRFPFTHGQAPRPDHDLPKRKILA